MRNETVIRALERCIEDKCEKCPCLGQNDCVTNLLRYAAELLKGNEDESMAYGCLDSERDRERLIAEREKMVAEINEQRRQLDKVLQENKLLQAQMEIIHMIFGRRNANG